MTTDEGDQALPTATHLITIPIPSIEEPIRLIAHSTLFKGPSLLLWCGECSESYSASTNGSIKADPMLIEQHLPEQPSNRPQHPTARLKSEWAVAMTNARNNTTQSTSLYRTNADLAQPMSARLSKRFKIAQIFLSLSLPQAIIEGIEGPHTSSEGGRALLMIEGALKDILMEILPQQ